jgi:hypothetical protein
VPEKKRPQASERTGDRHTAIRKTMASDGGASDMNMNSHGSSEEERREGERRKYRVSELRRRGGGVAARSPEQGTVRVRGERRSMD